MPATDIWPTTNAQLESGGGFFAEVDGDPTVLVLEHGDELQAGAEGFEVLAKGRHADIVGMFQLRDRSLSDIETPGEVDLADARYPAAVATWDNAWERFIPFLGRGTGRRLGGG